MSDQYPQLEREKVVLGHDDLDLLQEGGFQILSALMSNPTTTRQLAIRLGLNRARVQYTIDKLMKRGIASVHQEVQENGRGEVYYTASANDVMIALDKGTPQQAQAAAAQIVLSSVQTNLARALADETSESKLLVKFVQCKLDEAQLRVFIERLHELAREFSGAEDSAAEHEYGLALVLYPVVGEQGHA
ncbi:MAG TPA: winged helix-turn-helix domain-containing protein [Herpetosiphonaceae bacterium]